MSEYRIDGTALYAESYTIPATAHQWRVCVGAMVYADGITRSNAKMLVDREAEMDRSSERIAELEATIKRRDETILHDAALFGAKLAEAQAEVTQLHADAAVDPEGGCTCDDEGACGWCLFKRVEELSSAIATAQGHLDYDIAEEPEKRVDAVVWNANMKAGQALREAVVQEGASMTSIRPIGVDGSGELEFKIQIDNREASIWLSREMWDAFATFWDKAT